ncbi:hypothetical protein AAIO99_30235, partial [Streptomyces sp. AC154]
MSVPRSCVPLRLPYVLCAVLVLLLTGCGSGGLLGTGGSAALKGAPGASGVPGPPRTTVPSPAASPAPSSAGRAARPRP